MTIQEVARRARVTPRTIRYYVEQGVLPPPERGRPARYTNEHLRRLALIRRLKEQHLPLEEIRDTMSRLSLEEVDELLTRSEAHSAQKLSSAADYISGVLERGATREEMKMQATPQPPQAPPPPPAAARAPAAMPAPASAPMRRRLEEASPSPERAQYQEGYAPGQRGTAAYGQSDETPVLGDETTSLSYAPGQETTWRRVPLAPGIELHFQQTNDARINETVARLLEAAARILEKLPERWRNLR